MSFGKRPLLFLACYTVTRKSKKEVITMVTLEEAREIAAGWLTNISGCTEFSTAYAFYNPRTEDSIGGPDASVVVMKKTGKRCGFTEFIMKYGGGEMIREIKF